jgi:hypothetical protein
MAGEVRNLRILTIKFTNSEKATKNCKKILHYGFERLEYRLKFEIGIDYRA